MRISLKIDFFWRKFSYSGLNNFPSLSKFKRHQKLDKKKYKSIIKTYFTTYFNEVYFIDRPFYFFFGGLLMKVRCGNWVRKNEEKNRVDIASHSVGLFWYKRPCPRFWYSMDIRKVKGSTNMIPKIEKDWKASNDILLLPLAKNVKKKFLEDKKVFKTIKKQ